MKHIVLAVVGSQGKVSTHFAAALSKTSQLAKEKNVTIHFDMITELTSGISSAIQKNLIANRVLDSKTVDGVVFVSPNLSWDEEDFFKLINCEEDGVLSGAFVDSFEGSESYAIGLTDYKDVEGELSNAEYFSMGFAYVPKKVLKGLTQFVEVLADEDSTEEDKFYLFFKESVKDSKILQEDYYFCAMVKASGFKLQVDSRINCTNHAIMALRTDYQDYLARNWINTMFTEVEEPKDIPQN
jgi:hypothetical protein